MIKVNRVVRKPFARTKEIFRENCANTLKLKFKLFYEYIMKMSSNRCERIILK